MKVYYSDDYAAAEHAFETTRKARWIAASLAARPIPGVELVPPPPLSEGLLREVHDPAYVDAVRAGEPRALAQSQGFTWDPRLWTMVRASNGGVVAAAEEALATGGAAGSLSSGLHHARASHGAGFCTFNGLALAVRAARRATGRPLLVLDLDAHCGGGTLSLVLGEPDVWHVDVSVSAYDDYGLPGAARFSLDVVADAADYLPRIEARLAALPADLGLCLYNAGMDPFGGDPAGLPGITRDVLAARERLVFGWCRARRVPVAFVLAGGYLSRRTGHDEAALVDLHRLTLEAAAGLA